MPETQDPAPAGLILLSHPEQFAITPADMTEALPDAYKRLPRHTVELELDELSRHAVHSRDWSAARQALEEQVQARLTPLRKRHPDYRIIYFGSSPVPLALYLGFLIETWQQVEVIPHHHSLRTWGWGNEPGKPPARLASNPLPDYRDLSPGEAVIRISTSHPVNPYVTRQAVPSALLELDISLTQPGEDAFSSTREMQEVALAFRKALDTLGNQFPGIRRVHLFASVQPGMALLLGAQISARLHPEIQTYQYERKAAGEPYHVPAVLLNGPTRPKPVPLSTEEEARARADREHLRQDLEWMKGRAHQQAHVQSWIATVLSRPEVHRHFSGAWQHLLPLHRTPLFSTQVDVETRAVEDSFRLDPANNHWQIDDHWLARLARRLPDAVERQRALRQLVLHELAHRGRQALTRTSSVEIGRFPKVLEEIDYHADVWAMLHEYALTEGRSPTAVADPPRFFMELIRIATETMWVFDDEGPPLRELQIRRLNRYLIWYWQYLHLEHAAECGGTLDTVLSVLAQRPIIELAGPTVLTRNERVFFELDTARVKAPELALYHEGGLYRHGSRPDFRLEELLDGARTRHGKKMRDVLRGAFGQMVRR